MLKIYHNLGEGVFIVKIKEEGYIRGYHCLLNLYIEQIKKIPIEEILDTFVEFRDTCFKYNLTTNHIMVCIMNYTVENLLDINKEEKSGKLTNICQMLPTFKDISELNRWSIRKVMSYNDFGKILEYMKSFGLYIKS